MKTKTETRFHKKLAVSIITIIVLLICLCITTYALVKETIYVTDNYFHTGVIDINLNDGKPVIEQHEFLFEPGMTVEKDFFVQNNSTWEVYYRLYLTDVDGGLADVLQVTVKSDEDIICLGTANNLVRSKVSAAKDTLAVNERENLKIIFHYPEGAGNETQDKSLTFTLVAEAVQTKNNPEKLFD